MQLSPRKTRAIALLTGTAIAATTLLHPTPAHADKSKTYKYGAIALGALGAYLLVKGKPVPGAIAAGAGYYAYKKSKDAKNDERYGNYPDTRYPDDRYSTNYPDYGNYPGNPNGNYNGGYTYPDSGNYSFRSSNQPRYDVRGFRR